MEEVAPAPGGARPELSSWLMEVAAPRRGDAPAGATYGPGSSVDERFELVRPLGTSRPATTWEARDLLLQRPVAVKLLRRHAGAAAMLSEDAEALARFEHPNATAIHGAGFAGPAPYLVLELLRGESADVALARGPLPPARALEVAIQVAQALSAAHAAGVLHGDLRPSKVFLTAAGGVKVLDLGLARLLGHRPRDREVARYLAPEQRRGRAGDERSDVHALGVVLGELLRGAGERAVPLPDPRHAPGLDALLERMTDEDPTRRPRDGVAALAELLHVHDVMSVHRAWRAPSRRLGVTSIAAGIAVLGLLAGWLCLPATSARHERGGAAVEPPGPTGAAQGAAIPARAVTASATTIAEARNAGDGAGDGDGAAEGALAAYRRARAAGGALRHVDVAIPMAWDAPGPAEDGRAVRPGGRSLPSASGEGTSAPPGHDGSGFASAGPGAARPGEPAASGKDGALVRAWTAARAGRHREAGELLLALAEAHPEDAEVLTLAGEALWHGGAPEGPAEAVSLFRRALDLDPARQDALVHVFQWTGRDGRPATGVDDEALVRAERAAAAAPGPVALATLARARAAAGDLERAVADARRAAELQGGDPLEPSLALAEVLHAAGRHAEAAEALRRWLHPQASPGQRRAATELLAVSLAAEGRRREALEALDGLAGAGCGPRCAASDRILRVHLAACGGDLRAARDELSRWDAPAGSGTDEHLWLWPWLGLAEEGARRAAALVPGSRWERRYAGAEALRRGDAAEAARLLADLARRDPAVEVRFLLAEALLAGGRLREALVPLAQVTDAYPLLAPRWLASLRARGLLLRARTLAALGERDAARAQLARLARAWQRADRDLAMLPAAQAVARGLGRSLRGLASTAAARH